MNLSQDHDPNSVRDHVRAKLDELNALRAEIRARIHHGGLEAKQAWGRLEPEFDEAARLARDATHRTSEAIEGLVAKFRRFRDSLPRR